MLKDDEPVNVTSNRLEYDGAAGVATYTGDAKLFQARTRVQGDTIIVDDRTANLTARGHVSSVMFFEETDAATKTTNWWRPTRRTRSSMRTPNAWRPTRPADRESAHGRDPG